MTGKRLYVGMDYHDKSVQVCVIDEEQRVLLNKGCGNDWRAIAQAVAPKGAAVRAALESCSGSAQLAEELAEYAGWSVDLAHPGYVQRMKQNPDKSDFSDAQMLADLERVGYVPRVWLAPEPIRELRRLVHHRRTLADHRRAAKQRIGAALRDQRIFSAPGTRWTRKWLRWLREEAPLSAQSRWIMWHCLRELTFVGEQLAETEERLEEITREDPVVQQLRSLKGIGLVTACELRASVGRFDRFTSGKQLARFCGLSPRNTASGQRQTPGGLISACDRRLRAAIIQTAHRLKRFDPRWRALAQRMSAEGKPAGVIVAAVGNRWLRWLYHQMKPLGLSL